VDQFPEIERHIKRCGTGIGKDITGIFVGNTCLLESTVTRLYSIMERSVPILWNGFGSHRLEPILGAIPLTTLGEATMPVSHQLMGTGSGNTFNLEGEVDMLHD
jgi:hypothetical protein